MKRAVLVAMALFVFATLVFAGEFYGSPHSHKYHYPGCRLVRKIRHADLIIFANPEQAVKTGYRPCRICAPPLKSTVKKDRNGFFSWFAAEEEQKR